MTRRRWETFRNLWWGFWLGILVGVFAGVWIADRTEWKPFASLFGGVISGFVVFLATLPDLVRHIIINAKRFRSASQH